MVKKKYIITGLIFLVALALGFIFGWGIERIGGVLTIRRVAEVSEEISPSARSVNLSQQTNYQEAIKYYKGILDKSPNDINAISNLADAYFGMNNFRNAIRYYKMIIELDPKDVASYNDLGLSYHYVGHSDEGLKYIEEGVKIAPLHQRIWLTKGFILATTGAVAEAIKAWDEAYVLGPDTEVGKAALDFLNQYRPISSLERKTSESTKSR